MQLVTSHQVLFANKFFYLIERVLLMEINNLYLLQISAIYVACIGFGLIMKRLKLPVVLGYIAAGVLLGIFSFMKPNGSVPEFIVELSKLGVIFFLFTSGLKTDISKLINAGTKPLVIAFSGVIVSIIFATILLIVIKGDIASGLFLGVVVAATSVSISAHMMQEIGHMKSREGLAISGAAILDDIIGIILIAIMVIIAPNTGGQNLGTTNMITSIGVFIGCIALISMAMIFMVKYAKLDTYLYKIFAAIAIASCLTIAYLASQLGSAVIISSYFCGLIFSTMDPTHKVWKDTLFISDVFVMPIFFASIGLGVSISDIGSALGFGVVLYVIAVVGKVAGCGLGAKLSGFNMKESLRIGSGMVPRGEVAIMAAGFGASIGMLSQSDVAATIVLVLATAITTMPILKAVFKTPVEIGN
jgi:Kef-type K+ transport system membrane component KefB